MQLRVIKADDTEEEYLHTKVIATFINAFGAPSEKNTATAQQLAEAVTFYLYNKHGSHKITSSEISSIIKAVLTSTGFDNAADFLSEHHQRRNLLRARVQVIKVDMEKISPDTPLRQIDRCGPADPWNKSKIIHNLVNKYNLQPAMARTVASLVEEKILNSGFRLVPTGFIRFLVLWQMQTILSAQQQIITCKDDKEIELAEVFNAVTEDRLRQPQNGLCPVEA
jgi:transcriptional regulator NrdR family protein